MESPTMEQFNRLGDEVKRLSDEVKRLGEMMVQMIDLVGTLGAEMREGFRNQQAQIDSLRSEVHTVRDELKADIQGLRHDLRSERRARGHWQAEMEHHISSLELQLEQGKG